jgi:hypothetical protein
VTRAKARPRRHPPLVLVVAGSDPSGGAGLELDLKVLALHGVHGAAVASCQTLQNARGVVAIEPLAWRGARALIELVRDASPIGAVKIGMLADEAGSRARRLFRAADGRRSSSPGRRADARAGSSRGARSPAFATGPAASTCSRRTRTRRARSSRTLRPNLARRPTGPRARCGLGPRASSWGATARARRDRVVVDRLRGAAGGVDLKQPRQSGASPRGTGCAFRSAIAAGLARGASLANRCARRDAGSRSRGAAHPIGAGRRPRTPLPEV